MLNWRTMRRELIEGLRERERIHAILSVQYALGDPENKERRERLRREGKWNKYTEQVEKEMCERWAKDYARKAWHDRELRKWAIAWLYK